MGRDACEFADFAGDCSGLATETSSQVLPLDGSLRDGPPWLFRDPVSCHPARAPRPAGSRFAGFSWPSSAGMLQSRANCSFNPGQMANEVSHSRRFTCGVRPDRGETICRADSATPKGRRMTQLGLVDPTGPGRPKGRRLPTVSVVLPTLNEAANLPHVFARLPD